MKSIFHRSLMVLFLSGMVNNAVRAAVFEGGTGTQSDPYLIATAQQMSKLSVCLHTTHTTYFRLACDIDMSGIASWTPFNAASPYGKRIDFDGDGHTIYGFRSKGNAMASFAGVLNGSVRNVRFLDAQVQNTQGASGIGIIGAMVGTESTDGVIENVWVEGKVKNLSSSAHAGGVAGHLVRGSIGNCYARVDVTSATAGDRGTGGICGYEYDGKNLSSATDVVNTNIHDCYFCGSVIAPLSLVGGILGKGENRYGNYVQRNIVEADSIRGIGNGVGLVTGRIYDQAISRGLSPQNHASHNTLSYYGQPYDPVTTPSSPFGEHTPIAYADSTAETLRSGTKWKKTTLGEGCMWYNFESTDLVSKAQQVVNVLSMDMKSGRYRLDIAYQDKGDSLSAFVKRRRDAGIEVLGGVNANYEMQSIYVRSNGQDKYTVTIDPSDVKWWKHEGAIMGYHNGDIRVRMASREDGSKAISLYRQSTADHILASSPMLIEDFENVGSTFVNKDRYNSQFNSLDYEDADRHQGVRHPRTAVATTEDGHLLLVTVDGRATKAAGMNADELSRFLIKHFNPRYALNLDGGGSTTMCIPGYGQPQTNVVNYPTDNSKFDHWGQRSREMHLIIERCIDPHAFFAVPDENGQQNSSHHGQIFMDEASRIASQLGWDTTLWDLTGNTPRLSAFGNKGDAIGSIPTSSQSAGVAYNLGGCRISPQANGVQVQKGRKVIARLR